MTRQRIVIAVTFVALFALGWWVGRSGATGDLYGRLDTFLEVLNRVEANYVDPVDADSLLHGAIDGLVKDLDPYSQYLEARDWENLQTTTQGEYAGIGVVVGLRDGFPTVISPIEGSPGWRAGLRSGDIIARIEGKSSEGLSIDEVASRLRGAPGTKVTIVVRREGEDEREVTIERDTIVTKAVPYAFTLPGGVGYVRLASFSERSGEEVREALERLRKEGATRAVLDLRSNPGGLLDQAVDVAETFLPKGQLVVYTRGRAKAQEQRYFTDANGGERDWPLAVLIDPGSASASEIVAGALQDLDRALLVGETSFGKGLVQSVYPLRDKRSALKLTTARYYTPSGRCINRDRRDSLAVAYAEDDEALDETYQHPPDDSLPKPKYATAGGRVVFGGGGITPDLVVKPDTLGPVALRVERRALNLKYANRWVGAHAEARAGAPLDEATWDDFAAFLVSERAVSTRDSVAAERVVLARGLRREIARRVSGDAAAARGALEGDPVLERALAALGRSKDAAGVFAAAATEAPKGTTAAKSAAGAAVKRGATTGSR